MQTNAMQQPVPHVLVVDDDHQVLKAFSHALGRMKINVHLADGPDCALKVLREHPVDVVISDYRMPKTDGGSLLRQVQAQWPETVRILITAFASPEEVEAVTQQAGLFRALAKPCQPEELCAVVADALKWKNGSKEPTPNKTAVVRVDGHLFGQLFHTASDLMMIADLEGNIVEVNSALVRTTGGSRGTALERRPTIASGWQVVWPAVKRALLEHGRWSGEAHHVTEDRFAALSISVMNDEDGNPCALAVLEKDITTYRKLEQESHDMQYNVPLALAKLAEFREQDTGNHLERMRYYCWTLAVECSRCPKFSGAMDNSHLDAIYAASPLHDVGKVGIPDNVLLKPGKLTDSEWQVMRTHSRIGAEILALAGDGAMVRKWLETGHIIALQHHEKWDGSGYPAGLEGEEIDLSARIVALADAYDAITSKRVYKGALSHDEALKRIKESSGSHFDPEVVSAFLRIEDAFRETMMREKQERPEVLGAEGRSASCTLRRIDSVLLSLHHQR